MSESIKNVWRQSLGEAQVCLARFLDDPQNLELCDQFSRRLLDVARAGGNVFTCGNGGSHCDAMHFAEELTGRYRRDRRPLGALALGDASHVTCVSNDYGFEHIFARQLGGLARRSDLVIGFSTSGNSPNLLNAFATARERGVYSVALLGKGGGKLREKADLAIVVPGETSDRIQELHIKIVHIVIETLERELFPENYETV